MINFIQDVIQEYEFFFTLFLFIFGACVGSFLNVCILRMPDEQKSVTNPKTSHCPKCNAAIQWYDNLPIVSYLFLKGKCRNCRETISPQYMLIEILTGWLFVQFYEIFGLTPAYPFYFTFICLLLVATIVDFRHQIIPDEINFFGMIFACAMSVIFPQLHGVFDHAAGLGNAVLGLLAGGGSIYITGCIGDFVFKKESMGGGDVKLMAMVGAFLGWKLAILTYFLAPFFGAAIGIYAKYVKKEDIIPYGPFLSFAALLALFAGDFIMKTIWGIG